MSTKPIVFPPKLYTYQELLALRKKDCWSDKINQEEIGNGNYPCDFCKDTSTKLKDTTVFHYRKSRFLGKTKFFCNEICTNLWILKNGPI